MPEGVRRVRLICEDRLTERFLSKVCQRQKVSILHVEIAPSGKGAASAWVRRRYPEFVKMHRSKNYQRNLCLLVAIDGDNQGVSARTLELATELTGAGIEARGSGESIAVFVPTWSIETWLASLVDGRAHDEDRPLKEDSAVRHFWQNDESKTQTINAASDNWRARTRLLPSLAAAYAEGKRIGV
ncbi:MAG: hypothetical protein E6J90_30075 [Deltaproteobacteria bacterium]|nr:MAG: hypothetical protein E6J91_27165 [Deltaproteobacteria bacterium]TMQ12817.1 MAG: hypothetical protein E6J90_30075 [Deltaproteobacteria bacterium]